MAKKSRELFMREKKKKWREIKVSEVTKRERDLQWTGEKGKH